MLGRLQEAVHGEFPLDVAPRQVLQNGRQVQLALENERADPTPE